MTTLPLPSGRKAEFAVISSIAAFAALMAAFAVMGGGAQIWQHLRQLDGTLLLVLLALSLVNYGVRILRWHAYSRHLGLQVPLRTSAVVYVAGFALTTTPGRVGEALRLWFLERMRGLPYRRTLPLLVADRISDMGAVGILMLAALTASSPQPWLLAAAALAVSAMMLLTVWPRSAVIGIDLAFAATRRWPRHFSKARGAARRTATLFSPKLAVSTVSLALIGWMAESFAFYLLLQALGAPVDVFDATLIFTAGMVVGALTLVPGGLGGTEATMLGLLALQGVPMSLSIPATLIIRVTTLWFAVGLGFAAMPYAMRSSRAPAR